MSDTPQGQDSAKNHAQETKQSDQQRRGATSAEQTAETDKCYAHSYHATPRSRWQKTVDNIDWSQVVLDLLLIIIGVKLACIYSGQLSQMIESNRIAVTAMQQSQRPWIGPDVRMPIQTMPIIIDKVDTRGVMARTDYQMTAISYGSYGANSIQFWAQLHLAQDLATQPQHES